MDRLVLKKCFSLTYIFAPGRFLLGLHLLHWLISVSLDGLFWDWFVWIIGPSGAGWPLGNLRIYDTLLLCWPHIGYLRGVVKRVVSEELCTLRRIWRGAAQLWIMEWVGVTGDLLQSSGCISWRRTAGLVFINVAGGFPWRSALVVHLSLLFTTFQIWLFGDCESSRALWCFRINLGRIQIWRKGWGFADRDVQSSASVQCWRSYLKDRKVVDVTQMCRFRHLH